MHLVSDGPQQTLDEDETDEIVDYWYHFYPPARITNVTTLHVLWENVNFAIARGPFLSDFFLRLCSINLSAPWSAVGLLGLS